MAGVTLSHPDKLLFPADKLSKRDIAQYYEKVSAWMVPHLAQQAAEPGAVPGWMGGQCFYQKHADKSVNAAVERIVVPEGDGTATYLAANSTEAVVALLQWGVIEIHPWGSSKPKLDRPDRLIFDFDPDDAVAWPDLVSAVQVMRTLLDDLGLKGFLKTTGGKGLHIVVPVRPTIDWDVARSFTKAVAGVLVSTFPTDSPPPCRRRSAKARSSSIICATARGDGSRALFGARAPARPGGNADCVGRTGAGRALRLFQRGQHPRSSRWAQVRPVGAFLRCPAVAYRRDDQARRCCTYPRTIVACCTRALAAEIPTPDSDKFRWRNFSIPLNLWSTWLRHAMCVRASTA